MKSETVRAMLLKLLQMPGCTLKNIAKQIGVHEETIRKLRDDASYKMMPAKQLELIKLYCARKTTVK